MTSADDPRPYLWVCANGMHLKLSASAYHLMKSVESGATFEAIAAAMTARQGRHVAPDAVETAYQHVKRQIETSERIARGLGSGFWLKLPFLPARMVQAAAGPLSRLFQPQLSAALLAAMLLSLGVLAWHGASLAHTPGDYWLGYLLFLGSVIAHEFGHASACRRYGAQPRDIGFALYWIYPVFYSDVNAAWQLRRWQRVVVDLGGAYFQGIVAALFAAGYELTAWQPLRIAIYMIVYSCVFSLNPFLRFDGYWIVSDALNITNLSRQPALLRARLVAALRRKPVAPLPWSRGMTAFLAVYTLGSVGFWLYFVAHILPLLAGQLLAYPLLVLTVLRAARELSPELAAATLQLASATFTIFIAGLMIRRVAQPLVAWARRRGLAPRALPLAEDTQPG